MSQRDSGYQRKALDSYETPAWVTRVLFPYLDAYSVWEPAQGSGKMTKVLAEKYSVTGTDIDGGNDFLKMIVTGYGAIVTNPPYSHATEFIEHALNLTQPIGKVAMLLRTDFDHAKGRERLFRYNRMFARKIVLTKRIKWFEDSKGQPSFNHAWFIWDWKNLHAPILSYGP